MGIGRSFQEALHKATQSLEIKRNGLGADGKGYKDYEVIMEKLANPSWDRVFVIYDAIQIGIPLSTIHDITKIDMWFLKQYEELHHLEKKISELTIDSIDRNLMLEAKQKGYGDRQIAHMLDCLESEVYNKRAEIGFFPDPEQRLAAHFDAWTAGSVATGSVRLVEAGLENDTDGQPLSEFGEVPSDAEIQRIVFERARAGNHNWSRRPESGHITR